MGLRVSCARTEVSLDLNRLVCCTLNIVCATRHVRARALCVLLTSLRKEVIALFFIFLFFSDCFINTQGHLNFKQI